MTDSESVSGLQALIKALRIRRHIKIKALQGGLGFEVVLSIQEVRHGIGVRFRTGRQPLIPERRLLLRQLPVLQGLQPRHDRVLPGLSLCRFARARGAAEPLPAGRQDRQHRAYEP